MVSLLQLGMLLTMSICVVGSIKTVNSTYYLFYAPRRFSIEEGLNVTVVLFGKLEKTTKVVITLKDGDKDLKTTSRDISSDERILFFKLNTGDLEIKQYTLHLNLGGKLKVTCDYGSITNILTDKEIYKPGDKVKIRVLNVYRNFTARDSPATVYIKDAKGNLLSKMQFTSENGVSQGEFQISSRPALGTWTIEVEQDGKKVKKTVEVKEYVLPKVEVIAEIPKYIYSLDYKSKSGKFSVTVKARYTQGKPVSGTAKLHLKGNCLSKTSFTQDIVKETTFEMDLDEISSEPCYYFTVNVSVVNKLDGKDYYADIGSVYVTSFPINIFQDYRDNIYRPNVTSRFKVNVNRFDGQPLTGDDRKEPLEISIDIVNFTYAKSSTIPENGVVEFSFTPPNVDRLPVKVTFKGEYQEHEYQVEQTIILTRVPESGSFSLTRKDDKTSNPEFLLTFAVEVTDFFYTIVYGAKVFTSKHVQQAAAKSAYISFNAAGMFPKAYLVVGYNDAYGELYTLSASVDVERPTKGWLDANFKTSPVKPGQEAELVIKGYPNTTTFITAVDKSVLLLAKKKDLDLETILNQMESNDGGESFGIWNEVWQLRDIGITSYTNLNTMGPIVFDDGFVRKSENSITPGKTGGKAPKPRTNFQETWIWDAVDIGSTGTASLVKPTPDTITSWVVTMFGMHPTEGFISNKQEVALTTFKDFYISLGIPYSVVSGEKFELKVYVFNYVKKDATVTVQLMNSDNTVKEEKTVKMAADETEVAVAFEMEPKDVGNIPVLVQASIPDHSDAVQRILNVIAEGSTFEKSLPLSVNVSSKESFTKLVNLTYPPDVVQGSKFVSVSVIGDIMGPVLNSLDNLIRFPTGCGEQTMLSLYPGVLVYAYLESRSRLDGPTKQKIVDYTRAGYQNELRYQHKDGSFSAFGEGRESGSTWLTAYVIKCFCKAKLHMKDVTIDSKVIERAVSWLLKQQQEDGTFREKGNVIHKDMQGGTSSGVTMTAFVAISLLQCQELNVVNMTEALSRTAGYLRGWVRNRMAKDDYSRSVVLTAFALLKDDDHFDLVSEGSFSLTPEKDTKLRFTSPPKFCDSKSVEIAGYVLLAYSYKRKVEESLPFHNFLVSQQNSHGGFCSTQDTVMALEANAQFALLFSQKKDTAVDVKIETDDGSKHSFETITYENAILLKKKDLLSNTKTVKVEVTGNGYALVQVNWQYNLLPGDKDTDLSFAMRRMSSSSETAEYKACVTYTGDDEPGMSLITVNALSGYSANPVDPSYSPLIKKSEVEDNKLVIYLDSLTEGEELCIPVKMDLETEVENRKPQIARAVLYYQPDQNAETVYSISDPVTASGNLLRSACLVITLLSTVLFKLLV